MRARHNLRALDILRALIEEASITSAAHRLNIGASSIALSLEKFRSILNDPLLVRAGQKMGVTTLGRKIQQRIEFRHSAENILGEAVSPAQNVVKRVITIQAAEPLVSAFGYKFVQSLRQICPEAAVLLLCETPEETPEILRSQIIDLYVGTAQRSSPSATCQILCESRLVGMVRAGHPILQRCAYPGVLAAYEHIAVTRSSLHYALIDEILTRELGMSRDVTILTPSYDVAMKCLPQTDLVLILPDFLAHTGTAHDPRLRTFPLAINIDPIVVYQAWEERFVADPVHHALRESVRKLFHDRNSV